MRITHAFAFAILCGATLGGCAHTHHHTGARLPQANTVATGLKVKVAEVGDGDELYDQRARLVGIICSVGPDGLRNEWSDGYYEGDLRSCSDGHDYDFEYVKVEAINE